MTAEEVKQSITGWCSSDNDLEITGERQEPMTDFALGLRVGGVSGSPVELEVLQGQGADRLTVRRTASVAGDTGAAKQLIDSRPGSVSAQIARSNGDTSVTAQTFVYLDGLNKHSFVQAVSELARTSRLLAGLGAAGATTAQPAAAAEPATVAAATSQPM